MDVYAPSQGSHNELLYCKTFLNSLTEVYRKHFNNEEIAFDYLCGIAYIPEYVEGNAVEQMLEIIRRFPNNDEMKQYCCMGLYLLATRYDNRGDLSNAECVVKYLKMLYDRYPTNDAIIHEYARTLWHIYRNKGFFVKRKAVAELKKIVEQHPDEQTMEWYRATKNYGAYYKEEMKKAEQRNRELFG